jgi:hypothetical protein
MDQLFVCYQTALLLLKSCDHLPPYNYMALPNYPVIRGDFIVAAVVHYITERSPTDYPFLCKTHGLSLKPMEQPFRRDNLHNAHRWGLYPVEWPNDKKTIVRIRTSPSTFIPDLPPDADDIEVSRQNH